MKTKLINKTDSGTAEILIYDEIGADFWGEGMTAKEFVQDLNALTDVTTLQVRINSPGGEIFDGLSIYQALVRHPAQVETITDGLAGSIASVIFQAGDRRLMADTGSVFIHEPHAYGGGTAEDHESLAGVLRHTRKQILDTYVKNAGEDRRDSLSQAMASDTWYDAGEAIAAGLADDVVPGMALAACLTDEQAQRLYGSTRVPKKLLARRRQRAPGRISTANAAHNLGAAAERLRTLTRT